MKGEKITDFMCNGGLRIKLSFGQYKHLSGKRLAHVNISNQIKYIYHLDLEVKPYMHDAMGDVSNNVLGFLMELNVRR